MQKGYLSGIALISCISALASIVDFAYAQDTSTPIDFDPYVVTVSRFEEKALTAPASLSIIPYDRLAREGAISTVEVFRNIPGVDFQQGGMGRYMIAVRGFNNAFEAKTFTMVDNRESYNPALGVVSYSRLPIDLLDIERIEVVRGPSSALYGPGVAQGVIHFITKDPFEYPGTSISAGIGEQSLRKFSFRHAEVIGGKLAYKVTGSFMEANDWKMDPNDPHDAAILNFIVPELKNRFGEVERVITGRDYEVFSHVVSGEIQYRFSKDTRIKAYSSYSEMKSIVNASLGEIQVNSPGMLEGQLEFHSGGFYAQVYGITEYADGDNWFYRAGNLMYGRSSFLEIQAKYNLELWDGREVIVFGADYEQTTPKSKGTIFGRFEDEDQFSSYGAYIHTTTEVNDQLDITASGRIDHIDATDRTTFSPRLAAVYQVNPENTFRLTFNRATSRPTAGDYFGDMQVGGNEAFHIRWMGSAQGWTFSDPPRTSSFIGPGLDDGIGMATARAYSALAGGVAAMLNPDNPGPLNDYLLSKSPQVAGFSEGIMTFRSFEGELLGVASELDNQQPLKETITETWEIGYKGVIDEKFVLGIDGYYNKMNDFLFIHVVTPFVEVPGAVLSEDLASAVLLAFNDDELSAFGIDSAALANTYAAIGPALGDQPIGLIETIQSFNPDTPPEMIMPYLNAGTLEYFGVDFSIEAFFDDNWSAYTNFSWTSKNFFDEKAIGLDGTGYVISMNSPEEKIRAGIVYRSNKGLTITAGARYVGSFTVADGANYNGTVDSYTLFDLGIAYDFSDDLSRLKASLSIQNLFDKEHREYIGFPEIGRLASVRLMYEF
ncbi:MAG: TonB-dependent receptor [Puniceicoccaceae bacterium]